MLERLAGGASANTGGDLVAAVTERRMGLLARLESSLRGLVETRGVQAVCIECPVSGVAPRHRDNEPQSGLLLTLLRAAAS